MNGCSDDADSDRTGAAAGPSAPLTWVIGSGGLLGHALRQQLGRQGRPCFAPEAPWAWHHPATLMDQLRRGLAQFSEGLQPGQGWQIHWSAGQAVFGSSEADLEADRHGYQALLTAIGADRRLGNHHGTLVLASSAGAVYSGPPSLLIDEDTPPQALHPYGRWKLEQERMLRELLAAGHADAAFVARISTLYGPRQARGKRQGVISTIARQLVRRQPVTIFVPLDTMRDYIAVDDAARLIVAGSDAAAARGRRGVASSCLTRIVASEQPTAVSELLGLFRRLVRRPPQVITTVSGPAELYSRCVRYRSRCLPELKRLVVTSLPQGIAAVMAAESRALAQGNRWQR